MASGGGGIERESANEEYMSVANSDTRTNVCALES